MRSVRQLCLYGYVITQQTHHISILDYTFSSVQAQARPATSAGPSITLHIFIRQQAVSCPWLLMRVHCMARICSLYRAIDGISYLCQGTTLNSNVT